MKHWPQVKNWQRPPAPRYQDFIAWHVRQDRNKAQTFWREYLKGFSAATPIPVKNAAAVVAQKGREGDSASRYREAQMAVSGTLLDGLQLLAKQHRMTLNHIMQGVWAALLERYSGESDVLFGTTVSGRPADLAGIENMVGLFINTLPLRLRVDKQAPFIDWLQAQQDAQAELKFYEYSSLVDVQKASDLPAKQAMFESILVFENYPIDETLEETQASLRIGNVDAFQQTNFPLTLIIIPGRELLLRFSYDSHLFEPVVIERMLGHIQQMLAAIHQNPTILINQLPLLTDAERGRVVDLWNDKARPFPDQATLMELFEQQVQARPNQIACEFGDQRISYERLNSKANQLARVLISQGVKPNNPVALCFDRSLAMVEGMLAILKAGGTYVPIDPSYPQDRVQHMMDDTPAPLLLTSRHYSERFAFLAETAVTRVLELEGLAADIQTQADSNLNIRLDKGSRALAYIIYTSAPPASRKACVCRR
ncbi:MAG: condensation domain-containing protein [Gammaproteobacteria bacterium]